MASFISPPTPQLTLLAGRVTAAPTDLQEALPVGNVAPATGSENTRLRPYAALTWKRLRVALWTAPGAATTVDVGLAVNGSLSALKTTWSDADAPSTTKSATGSIASAAADAVSILFDRTAGVNGLGGYAWWLEGEP